MKIDFITTKIDYKHTLTHISLTNKYTETNTHTNKHTHRQHTKKQTHTQNVNLKQIILQKAVIMNDFDIKESFILLHHRTCIPFF